MQVRYVSVEDVPAEFVAKEKEIEMGKEDLASKPAQIREKIVDGRIAKRLAELALLEQAYIRDDKMPVKDLVKETTAKLGEKVQVCVHSLNSACEMDSSGPEVRSEVWWERHRGMS